MAFLEKEALFQLKKDVKVINDKVKEYALYTDYFTGKKTGQENEPLCSKELQRWRWKKGKTTMVLLKRLLQRKNAIDRFWQWFQEKEDLFYILPKEKKEKLFEELDRQLAKVNRHLIAEFSAEFIDGKRAFVVSADGISKAFPEVIQLVEEAPKLNRFHITAFRQPISGDLNLTVEVNGLVLSHSDLFFTGAINEETGRIDLVLYIKKNQKKEAFQGAALMLLDALIGEYKAGTCLGRIECQPFDQNKQALPICDLLSCLEEKCRNKS